MTAERRVYEVKGDEEGAVLYAHKVLQEYEGGIAVEDAQSQSRRLFKSDVVYTDPVDAMDAFLAKEREELRKLEEVYKRRRKIYSEVFNRRDGIHEEIENGVLEEFDYFMMIGRGDDWEDEFGKDL